MKLGSSIINPLTNQRGICIRMQNGKPIGRDSEGKLFVGRTPRGRVTRMDAKRNFLSPKPKKKQPRQAHRFAKVRVREGREYLSGPVDAEYDGYRWRILGECNFKGVRLAAKDVEVQE